MSSTLKALRALADRNPDVQVLYPVHMNPNVSGPAREILGDLADDQLVQERAALIFGQFIWECVMNRPETWVFYDPNLRPNDPNRDLISEQAQQAHAMSQ